MPFWHVLPTPTRPTTPDRVTTRTHRKEGTLPTRPIQPRSLSRESACSEADAWAGSSAIPTAKPKRAPPPRPPTADDPSLPSYERAPASYAAIERHRRASTAQSMVARVASPYSDATCPQQHAANAQPQSRSALGVVTPTPRPPSTARPPKNEYRMQPPPSAPATPGPTPRREHSPVISGASVSARRYSQSDNARIPPIERHRDNVPARIYRRNPTVRFTASCSCLGSPIGWCLRPNIVRVPPIGVVLASCAYFKSYLQASPVSDTRKEYEPFCAPPPDANRLSMTAVASALANFHFFLLMAKPVDQTSCAVLPDFQFSQPDDAHLGHRDTPHSIRRGLATTALRTKQNSESVQRQTSSHAKGTAALYPRILV
ncbi:hypothetical protein C8J57DRAFT_1501443 [Mycena rebaudengoi]|nr:hypothetical protein C8J57DRAFT_1501443 [Mycena rebaudengoi]